MPLPCFSDICAVVVTTGQHDISPILESLRPFAQTVVWDNSKEKRNAKVYGRYLAVSRSQHDLIYVQDDDAIIDLQAFASALSIYRDGEILCNMPREWADAPCYQGPIRLVGWGALFHRRLVNFQTYLDRYPLDDLFLRECDRVFTGLNTCRNIDVPRLSLPYAFDRSRMGCEERHGQDLYTIKHRLESLKVDQQGKIRDTLEVRMGGAVA